MRWFPVEGQAETAADLFHNRFSPLHRKIFLATYEYYVPLLLESGGDDQPKSCEFGFDFSKPHARFCKARFSPESVDVFVTSDRDAYDDVHSQYITDPRWERIMP